jgi:hypothetical protein
MASPTPFHSVLPPAPVPSRLPYVLAAFAVISVALASVVSLALLRPDRDNTALYTIVVSMVAPTLTAILALIKGNENADAVQDLRVVVDGRLTQLLERTAQAERLAGRGEGEATVAEKVATVTVAAEKAAEVASRVAERTVEVATKAAEVAVRVAEAAAAAPPVMTTESVAPPVEAPQPVPEE